MMGARLAVDLSTYRRQGYLFEPYLLSSEEVDACAERLLELAAEFTASAGGPPEGSPVEYEPAVLRGEAPCEAPLHGVRRIRGLTACDPMFAAIAESSALLTWAEQLLGAAPRLIESTAILCAPRIAAAELWRQEAARYMPPPSRMVCVQIALDDATEDNGCMVLLRKSHSNGLAVHTAVHGNYTIDATAPEAAIQTHVGQPVLLPAGGAVLYDGRIVKSVLANRGAELRRAIEFGYVPAGEYPRLLG